jgi:hypothetical protein
VAFQEFIYISLRVRPICGQSQWVLGTKATGAWNWQHAHIWHIVSQSFISSPVITHLRLIHPAKMYLYCVPTDVTTPVASMYPLWRSPYLSAFLPDYALYDEERQNISCDARCAGSYCTSSIITFLRGTSTSVGGGQEQCECFGASATFPGNGRHNNTTQHSRKNDPSLV